MPADEGQGGGEFVGGGGGGGEGEERGERGGCQGGGEEQVDGCEEGGEEVLRDHHLRAGVGAVGAEDVVLGAVGEAVEEEVDGEEGQAPEVVAGGRGCG